VPARDLVEAFKWAREDFWSNKEACCPKTFDTDSNVQQLEGSSFTQYAEGSNDGDSASLRLSSPFALIDD
jgi:hypothetical protein